MTSQSHAAGPLPLWQVLEEEFRSLGGTLTSDYEKLRDQCRIEFANDLRRQDEQLVPAFYSVIHATTRDGGPLSGAALCLSGGGIRSATFNLGILQGLARRGLLAKFDYLSTVSGGGFIGSWLSAWIHRNGSAVDVQRALASSPVDPFPGRSSLHPEAEPIQFLRDYTGYLSPRLGLFSADTWTLAATYLRNLLLNWTVFIPILATALMAPRWACWAINNVNTGAMHGNWTYRFLGGALVVLGLAFTAVGLGHVDYGLPSLRDLRNTSYRDDQAQFIRGGLAWILLGAMSLAIGWSGLRPFFRSDAHWNLALAVFAVAAIATAVISGVITGMPFRKQTQENKDALRRVRSISWWGPIVLAASLEGALLWLILKRPWAAPHKAGGIHYACLAAPTFLLVLLITRILLRAWLTPVSSDEDREWSARAAAWVLICICGWSVVSLLVLWAPSVLLTATPAILSTLTAGGTLSGIVTALLTKSPKTPATTDESRKLGSAAVTRQMGLAIAAPLFVISLVIAVSLGTDWLLTRFTTDDAMVPESQLSERVATSQQAGEHGPHLTPLPILASSPDWHYRVTTHTTIRSLAMWTAVLLAIGLGMSLFVNINKYSLHSVYRNRLVRAYLGASRREREKSPTYIPFTGFDERDNIPLHRLRLRIDGLEALATRLKVSAPEDAIAVRLKNGLKSAAGALAAWDGVGDPPNALIDALRGDLCAMATGPFISLFGDQPDPHCQSPAAVLAANIRTLRRELPDQFPPAKPLHILNIALNLVSGDKLAWQQRKAESFTASALHCGSAEIGYRRSELYGGSSQRGCDQNLKNAISLGTALAISGAAASPNMGYHSSTALSLIMTLLNVRLGAWLGNPGVHGEGTFRGSSPRPAIRPLLDEAFGKTDDRNKYVYLSDGGHFENLGLYEMIRRRCRFILVSDAGQDYSYAFTDLGNAVRKVYVDMGVRIVFNKTIAIYPRNMKDKAKEGRYAAIATIHYDEVDKPIDGKLVPCGHLIYIKPAYYGEEPPDIYNYGQESPTFPHESTADQFFTESQFESYRALGWHVISQLCDPRERGASPTVISMEQFLQTITEYLASQGPTQSSSSVSIGP